MKKILIVMVLFSFLLAMGACSKTEPPKTGSSHSTEVSASAVAIDLPDSGRINTDNNFTEPAPGRIVDVRCDELFMIETLDLLPSPRFQYASFCFFENKLYFSAMDNETGVASIYIWDSESKKANVCYTSETGAIDFLTDVNGILFFADFKTPQDIILYGFSPVEKSFRIFAEIKKESGLSFVSCQNYLAVISKNFKGTFDVLFFHSTDQRKSGQFHMDMNCVAFPTANIQQNLFCYVNTTTRTFCYYDIDAEKVISTLSDQLSSVTGASRGLRNQLLFVSDHINYYLYDIHANRTTVLKQIDLKYCAGDEIELLDNVAVFSLFDAWVIDPVPRTIQAVNFTLRKQTVLFDTINVRFACSNNKNKLICIETANNREIVHLVTAKSH